MTTVLGGAMACNRAARFGVSPTMSAFLKAIARPDQIADDDHSGRYADTDLQANRSREGWHRGDQLQPGPYRALRIILVSLGYPK